MHRLPRAPRLVQVVGVSTRTHQVRDLIEFDVDPVTLAVRVRAQLLLRRNGTSAVRCRWLIGLPPCLVVSSSP